MRHDQLLLLGGLVTSSSCVGWVLVVMGSLPGSRPLFSGGRLPPRPPTIARRSPVARVNPRQMDTPQVDGPHLGATDRTPHTELVAVFGTTGDHIPVVVADRHMHPPAFGWGGGLVGLPAASQDSNRSGLAPSSQATR